MIKLAECTHPTFTKHGKSRHGAQRFKCKTCGVRFTEEQTKDGPLGNMRVDLDKAMMVVNMLLEGMSVRAAARLTGMDKDTICRLILEVGGKCQNFIDYNIVDVPVTDIQLDECWNFVNQKQKTARLQDDQTQGDAWTYIAIDRETKLVVAHHVGKRDQENTDYFLQRVRRGVDQLTRIHVSTDGWARVPLRCSIRTRKQHRLRDASQAVRKPARSHSLLSRSNNKGREAIYLWQSRHRQDLHVTRRVFQSKTAYALETVRTFNGGSQQEPKAPRINAGDFHCSLQFLSPTNDT